MEASRMKGGFVDEGDETWYRIEGYDSQPPFFMTLAGDSDLWAFISTSGSLTAGRTDQDRAFFPYETVDKIHLRWENTGPRTWLWIAGTQGEELWQPFAATAGLKPARRSVWKNLSGSRLRFREEDPSGRLAFQYEWATSASLGLVRTVKLEALGQPVQVKVLDGLLNLIPPGISFDHSSTMSSLTDAYKWNEALVGGRLALYSLYAKIWDRAEPKESFDALTVWTTALPAGSRTLLSAHQVTSFCQTGQVEAETLTRGRRGAFLVNFEATVTNKALSWAQVLDGPRSQVQVFELARRLEAGQGSLDEVATAVAANDAGLNELLAKADGFQSSGDPMAAAHHRANVLFNIMRGGVFVDGTTFDRDDLVAFIRHRSKRLGEAMAKATSAWPAQVERSFALEASKATYGPQAERLVLQYLPLTFSRRHGDPSRPWNRFSIKVRNAAGKRLVNYQGNWRDIFQNWEALIPSEPAYAGSMVANFLGAMTPDGYNPYRVSRDGIDWEVVEHDNPWSNIGYWGDHQVIYLLRLLEAAQQQDPALLESFWDRPLFSFADVPYRLVPYAQQAAHPKSTILFDEAADAAARKRAASLGSDGLLVCDANGDPVLGNLAEKLAVILLAKASSLVPGGGLWLHTQRPEWNDANNALVGNGLSIVTLAHLRRFLVFVAGLPCADRPFALPEATLEALKKFSDLVKATPLSSTKDPVARRTFLDAAGAMMDPWRAQAYSGAAGRRSATAPQGLLSTLARDLLPLVDASLEVNRRSDGLFQSYNVVDLATKGRAEVGNLYPMLEGQVALLSCGYLSLAQAVTLLEALFASPLYTAARKSFLLYPDRNLPGFLEKNRLDEAALALPVTKRILEGQRSDLLQTQTDGTVRFAPSLSNSQDLQAAGADLGKDLDALVSAYDRLLRHQEFTGRSGTMFGYEGLGCIYWHMVAKLLLAVQERAFEASDQGAKEFPVLCQYYRRVRDGLGYRKSAAEYGAFPADPYSHTPGEGGAQQPGMTGQVKEEVLTRWGELGMRVRDGRVVFDPILLDAAEVPVDGSLKFTYAGIPVVLRRGAKTTLKVRRAGVWSSSEDRSFDVKTAEAIEGEVYFQRG